MSKVRQFIKDCTRGCSNELCAVEDRYGKKVISYHEWLTPEQALAAVEIAKEEVIDKACKWLEENKEHPFIECEDPCLSGYLTDKFIEDFKKAMEE
jgi:hypothetical protein